MDIKKSFICGFNYGRDHGIELSAREISILFPNVNADAFAEGNKDGIVNDQFRLQLALGLKEVVCNGREEKAVLADSKGDQI